MNHFQKILFPVLCTLLICFSAAQAFAGSFENDVYTSNLGYSFNPPKDWIRLDASTVKAADVLPQNLKNVAFDRFDVVFYPAPDDYKLITLESERARAEKRKAGINSGELPAPGTPEAEEASKAEASARAAVEAPDFAPSLAVMVVENGPSDTTEDIAKSYANTLKKEAENSASFADDFQVSEFQSENLGDTKAMSFKMTYNKGSRSMTVDQIVFSRPDKAIVMTCVSSDKDKVGSNWCKKAAKTLKIN